MAIKNTPNLEEEQELKSHIRQMREDGATDEDIRKMHPDVTFDEDNNGRITPIDVSQYPDEVREQIFTEEKLRRTIEEKRNVDFQSSIDDDSEREHTVALEMQLKKDEFNVYLKKTFPKIVGDRKMTDEELTKNVKLNTQKSIELNATIKKINVKHTKRLAKEVARKRRESKFRFINYKESHQTYFEDLMKLGKRQKATMDPENDGLNEVQRIIRDMDEIERKLGRPIIPHRDIVENEESDFDSKTYTKPNDILIRPSSQTELGSGYSDDILQKISGLSNREIVEMREEIHPKDFLFQFMKLTGISKEELERFRRRNE